MPIKNILLVDDSKTELHLLSDMLTQRGFTVRTAENGEEAMRRLAEVKPDLILMDVQMPVMGGLEATRAMRAWERQEQRPRTPIIAMTANAMDRDRADCLEAGMDEHLAKPYKVEMLRILLARFLLRSE